MFSKACEYGIKAAIYIEQQSMIDKRVNVNQIAKEINSPLAFTAKVLQKLVKSKLIVSKKGVNGGYAVDANDMNTLNLLKIVVAIDGDGIVNKCVLGLNKCSDINPCPMHSRYSILRSNLLDVLQNTLLNDLANSINTKEGILKN